MSNKHTEGYSTSLFIRDMQSKITARYQNEKKNGQYQVLLSCGAVRIFILCYRGYNHATTLEKAVPVSFNIRCTSIYDLRILLLGTLLECLGGRVGMQATGPPCCTIAAKRLRPYLLQERS